jgi:hypothetical protein
MHDPLDVLSALHQYQYQQQQRARLDLSFDCTSSLPPVAVIEIHNTTRMAFIAQLAARGIIIHFIGEHFGFFRVHDGVIMFQLKDEGTASTSKQHSDKYTPLVSC